MPVAPTRVETSHGLSSGVIVGEERWALLPPSWPSKPSIAILNVSLLEEISASRDGNPIRFVTELPERPGQCSVSRAALEHHRWAPRGASEEQLLRAYQAGCPRIAVLVERDLLKTERVDHAAHKRTLLSNGRTKRST
jgi:hypothetical protein